jgi:hypothetical protein
MSTLDETHNFEVAFLLAPSISEEGMSLQAPLVSFSFPERNKLNGGFDAFIRIGVGILPLD